jgi:hypothetical protein
MTTRQKDGNEIIRLFQEYNAILAGAILGDENAVMDKIEEIYKKYDLVCFRYVCYNGMYCWYNGSSDGQGV